MLFPNRSVGTGSLRMARATTRNQARNDAGCCESCPSTRCSGGHRRQFSPSGTSSSPSWTARDVWCRRQYLAYIQKPISASSAGCGGPAAPRRRPSLRHENDAHSRPCPSESRRLEPPAFPHTSLAVPYAKPTVATTKKDRSTGSDCVKLAFHFNKQVAPIWSGGEAVVDAPPALPHVCSSTRLSRKPPHHRFEPPEVRCARDGVRNAVRRSPDRSISGLRGPKGTSPE